jgi:hypothetical protein
MHSVRYYKAEAETIRRAMYDLKDREIRTLLGRIARSYEQIAADLECGSIRLPTPAAELHLEEGVSA